MLRLLIVDDHPVVREGIKQILAETEEMVAAGEAENAKQALAKFRAAPYDAVVLDISMPGRSGLEILKEMKQEKPRIPVLILSIHSTEQYAIRCPKAGASGYLTKAGALDELVTAIRRATSGKKYISMALAETLTST